MNNLDEGDKSFVIATGNPGKRREFITLFDDFLLPEWTVYDRQSFPGHLDEVEETAETFYENAIKKALETSVATGCCSLADDSGLEVDALNGAPGVRSARFAGEEATDEENNLLLQKQLRGVPEKERTARFVAVICVALPDNQVGRTLLARRGLTGDEIESGAPRSEAVMVTIGEQHVVWFRGTVEGRIATEPAGDGGFGYDPYFYVPAWGKTMAQVPLEQKNQISHRANAARKLVDFFS